jgi:hypothetical protein
MMLVSVMKYYGVLSWDICKNIIRQWVFSEINHENIEVRMAGVKKRTLFLFCKNKGGGGKVHTENIN